MTKRLYFLLSDVDATHRVVDELRARGVDEKHMHVVARHDAPSGALPEAGLHESSAVTPAAGRGAAAGAVTGALAGLAAMVFPPAGIAIGGGAVAAAGLAGTGFGAWIASMIGIGRNSDQVQRFEAAIADGRVLMMIDVADKRAEVISNLVRHKHPKVAIHGA